MSVSMFGSKQRDAVIAKLQNDLSEERRKNEDAKNTIAHLVNSSKRWAKKFSNPVYRVPEQVIKQMEQEHLNAEARARAELDKALSRCAVLTERIIDLTVEKTDDRFGTAEGNIEISYDLAADHVASAPTEEDDAEVTLQLSSAWAKRMKKLSKGR